MPCVAILRERFYDIIVTADDDPENLQRLYYFGSQFYASGEEETPFDRQQYELAGEFWFTSGFVMFKNEAAFNNQFPNREIPMVLTIRDAEMMNWEDGIVRAGITHFGHLAEKNDPNLELVWPDQNNDNITNFNILKNFMRIVTEQRQL